MTATEHQRQVTRDDIEAKLREIRGEVEETARRPRRRSWPSPAVVARRVVGVAFLLGKRRGQQASRTVVEIRRV